MQCLGFYSICLCYLKDSIYLTFTQSHFSENVTFVIIYFYRFKVHLQVMDNTGSTSFILFDRNVSNYVGKSVQDLIQQQVYVY